MTWKQYSLFIFTCITKCAHQNLPPWYPNLRCANVTISPNWNLLRGPPWSYLCTFSYLPDSRRKTGQGNECNFMEQVFLICNRKWSQHLRFETFKLKMVEKRNKITMVTNKFVFSIKIINKITVVMISLAFFNVFFWFQLNFSRQVIQSHRSRSESLTSASVVIKIFSKCANSCYGQLPKVTFTCKI